MFGKKKGSNTEKKIVNKTEGNQNFLAAMRINTIDEIADKLKIKDEYQRTPLHRAIECEVDPKWIAIMLSKGAEPNAQDDNGNTPLHYAAQNGDMTTVQLLLDNHANPHIINTYKKTPLCDINALNHEHPLELYELLLKHNSRGCFWEQDSYLPEALHKSLIALGVKYYDPQHIEFDSQKNSLLHWACYYGLEEEVQSLIAKGCRLFAKNIQAKTGLAIATEREFNTIKAILNRAMAAPPK
ncbi:ankyrin repeat domain-containing protein [Candidatus Berkiella cookevillensis]|uniref:Ankyrin repeat domain-containing protein n=1 Tax=Candidatus Berkiella cookevillensis TaxID=437022 RepID=A0A0Q9YPT7_9GAMM|nr:ankyrin repeat domain-containing protein [Candidatus Berkiella cookevillensis]MCS5709618.1 ankyrin repeat domain-containing protein [Candidatus Berkiella cookevillensis]